MRKKKHKSSLSETSNAWLLLSLFLIVFFLYQYMHMNTVNTLKNYHYELFWFDSEATGASSLSQFYLIFILFGLWAVMELYSSIKLNHSDKIFCTITCLSVLVIIGFIQVMHNKEIDYFQHEFRLRSAKPLTFRLNTIPYIPFFSEWDKFKLDKKIKKYNFFECFSEKNWSDLKQEFITLGGEFKSYELEQLDIVPAQRHLSRYIVICD